MHRRERLGRRRGASPSAGAGGFAVVTATPASPRPELAVAADRHRDIVRALEIGAVDGLAQVSHVFLFDDHVYKLCRIDNDAFNAAIFDFADPDRRAAFVRQDFALNHFFSPAVYLALIGLTAHPDGVRTTGASAPADELAICMRRVDESASLTRRLLDRRIDQPMCRRVGGWLSARVADYPTATADRRRPFGRLMEQRLSDVDAFASLVSPPLAVDDGRSTVRWLRRREERIVAYLRRPPSGLAAGVDCHADNVFVEGEGPCLLDAFQIKPNWRIVDPLLNVCRLAVDLQVLGSRELAQALLAGFADVYPRHPLHSDVVDFYMVYGALIRVVLWLEGHRAELADRYLAFITDVARRV
jgi:aminoglycoside phosphotransferase family enzyme